MTPTGPPPKSPKPDATPPSSLAMKVRGALLIVALGLAGLYAFATLNPSQTLELRVVNKTGEVLKGLKIDDDPMGDLAEGATITADRPLAPSVVLELTADDVARRSTYPYDAPAGRRHQMTINLVKNKDGSGEGRATETTFSVMFGSDTTIVDPIDEMETVDDRPASENAPGPAADPEAASAP